MLHHLAYQTLKDITLAQKPYRGTHNRFPVGHRTQSNKYFLTEEKDGESIARGLNEVFCAAQAHRSLQKKQAYLIQVRTPSPK